MLINCIICENEKEHSVIVQHTEFTIIQCSNCDLISQTPIPDEKTLDIVYNSIYEESPTYSFGMERNKRFQKVVSEIENHVTKPGNFLDIGCSYGDYVKYFKDKGWKSQGIDLSKNAIDFAKKNGLNCEYSNIDDYKPSNNFDAILMSHVLEHTINPKIVLEKLYSWLSPNGIVLIAVPNAQAKAVKMCFTGQLKPYEHLYYFSENNLKQLFEKSNFQILSLYSYGKGFLADIISYHLRKQIVMNQKWLNLNYKTDVNQKKGYQFLKHVYEKSINILNHIPFFFNDREIILVARKRI